jgi:hypothetical protein
MKSISIRERRQNEEYFNQIYTSEVGTHAITATPPVKALNGEKKLVQDYGPSEGEKGEREN